MTVETLSVSADIFERCGIVQILALNGLSTKKWEHTDFIGCKRMPSCKNNGATFRCIY